MEAPLAAVVVMIEAPLAAVEAPLAAVVVMMEAPPGGGGGAPVDAQWRNAWLGQAPPSAQ